MRDELNGHHLIGLFRYTPGLPKASKQIKDLADAGVDMTRYAYDLNGETALEDVDLACKPPGPKVLPICLVTPFLGALGTSLHSDILASAGRVGGILYDVETDRVYTLKEAVERDEIVKACRKAQTAPGRHAAKGKGGPKKRFAPDTLKTMLREYVGFGMTIAQIGTKWDVSGQWLYNEFGGRENARRDAAERSIRT